MYYWFQLKNFVYIMCKVVLYVMCGGGVFDQASKPRGDAASYDHTEFNKG